MKPYLIVVFAIILTLIFVLTFFIRTFKYDGKAKITVCPIYIESVNDTVYLKRKNWGITGDYQIVVLSNNSKEEILPNLSEEYVFKGSTFFYKVDNSMLHLFVRVASDIPVNFKYKDYVIQEVLTNPEMMNLYDTYEKEGIRLLNCPPDERNMSHR